MRTGLLGALIASLAVGAQANPIVFTNAQYDTTAFAISGASADAHAAASPSSPLPLVSSAVVLGANDFATSFALATSGLLSSSAEADSFPGAVGANSGAQTHFVGSFLGSGPLELHLAFLDLNSIFGGGTADATLFVLLTNVLGSTTTTLFNDFFTASGDIDLQFDVAGGVTSLDLLLFSEASTSASGQSGQNFAQVTFDGTIAAPPTLLLVLSGLGAIVITRRKNNSGVGAAVA